MSIPKVLAIMGLRSGSKGLPDKNIMDLCGFPLFTWVLSAAERSSYVNRIFISTDSSSYQNLINSYGNYAEWLRPPHISGDNCPEIEFVSHTLSTLENKLSYTPDIVVRLLVTVFFS